MNYFCHGRRFVDDPYFLAGTAIPDWLSIIDRKVRVRSKHAQAYVNNADPQLSAIARGVVQHHHDDGWFHATGAFLQLSMGTAVLLREKLPPDDSLRTGFLGHILVELLLDWVLIDEQPQLLERYYAALSSIDPQVIEQAVNEMSPGSTDRMAWLIPRFVDEGFLWDYADDDKLMVRLNQVLRRVRLPPLSEEFLEVLPVARSSVQARRHDLLPEDRN